jgi:hypothetical protein
MEIRGYRAVMPDETDIDALERRLHLRINEAERDICLHVGYMHRLSMKGMVALSIINVAFVFIIVYALFQGIGRCQ